MSNFDPREYGDYEDDTITTDRNKPKRDKQKNNARGCALGCLSTFAIVILLAFTVAMCAAGGTAQEEEWLETLKAHKEEIQTLYARTDFPDKAEKADQIAKTCEEEYNAIREETGKSQLDDQLLRGYVCAKQMAIDVKHIARGEDPNGEYYAEYQEANSELYDIIKELEN